MNRNFGFFQNDQLLGGGILQKQLLLANELEAKNIKQLEKQLGLARRKSKKLPKSFQEDGLDYVITACHSGIGNGTSGTPNI